MVVDSSRMKQLDLQKSIENFVVFDILMILIAAFGFLLALLGILLSGPWLYLTYLMILGESILAYGVFIAPKRLKIKTYRQAIGSNADVWVKIVFLSDFHFSKLKGKNWAGKITEKVRSLSPDILLIGGDIVVHDAEHTVALEPLKYVSSTYGSYFVLGNHDYQDDPRFIQKKLQEFGFHDLNNTGISLNVQGKELCLAGMDDGFYGIPNLKLKKSSKHQAHITLSHEVDIILNLEEGDTDLVIAGHSHGGQIRAPFYGSIRIPSAFGRKADFGQKIIRGIPAIISQGLGEVGVRARLFSPPEIVIIELGI